MRKLKPQRFVQIQDALLDAFRVEDIAVLARRLAVRPEELYAPTEKLPERIESLLVWADNAERIPELVETARLINPSNKQLAAITNTLDDSWYLSETATRFNTFVQKSISLRWPVILMVFVLIAVLVVIWQQLATADLLRGAEVMDGQFNVAVVDFGILDADGNVRADEFGAGMRSVIVNQLELEYTNSDLLQQLGGQLLVWHDGLTSAEKGVTLGVIKGRTADERAEAADTLAQAINADMVIYGYLLEPDDPDSLILAFHYSSERLRGEPDAIVGSQRLGAPISLRVDVADDPTLAKAAAGVPLGKRSRLLAWLTTGLALDAVGLQTEALSLFEQASQELDDLDAGNGREVLDYFIGREAFLLRDYDRAFEALDQALLADPTYANALITKGSTLYDRAQLFFLRDAEIPAGLQQCVSLDNVENSAESLADARVDMDQAQTLFSDAISAAESSAYPPLADTALLMRGQNSRLQAQALLFENDTDGAQQALVSAESDLVGALSGFEANDQTHYAGVALAGLGTTYELLAHVSVLAGNSAETEAYNEQALAQYDLCIELKDDPATSLFIKEKVIDCACVPYRTALLERLSTQGSQ